MLGIFEIAYLILFLAVLLCNLWYYKKKTKLDEERNKLTGERLRLEKEKLELEKTKERIRRNKEG